MAGEIPRHRCETCGFLALRNRITGLLDEAPQEYRWRAEIPKFRNPSVKGIQPILSSFYDYPYSGIPICLVRAYPLHNEFTNQEQATEKEIFGTLEKERGCAERGLFTTWQQGFTPKEHREMIDRESMFKEQAKQNRKNLAIAFTAVVIAAFGVFAGAYYNERAARLEAAATLRASEMQIEFQQSLLATPTPLPTIEPTPQSPSAPDSNGP